MKSGLYGGKNITIAPEAWIVSTTAWLWWIAALPVQKRTDQKDNYLGKSEHIW